jgi:hypothetical protein
LGRLAQLGERLVYTQEVGGSIPSPPIKRKPRKHELSLLPQACKLHSAGRLPSAATRTLSGRVGTVRHLLPQRLGTAVK